MGEEEMLVDGKVLNVVTAGTGLWGVGGGVDIKWLALP